MQVRTASARCLITHASCSRALCRYDKVKILLKEIQSCQYVACMNPTAGSFNITPRMQRHFATFAVQMPSPDIVRSIYLQILDGHLSTGGFDADIAKLSAKLVDATIELHRLVRRSCSWGGSDSVHIYTERRRSGSVCLPIAGGSWIDHVLLCGCLPAGHAQLPALSSQVPLPGRPQAGAHTSSTSLGGGSWNRHMKHCFPEWCL